MSEEQIFNGGEVLCRKISLYERHDDDDPVETLIGAIREAAEGLEHVRFEAEFVEDPYGGFGSHYLQVSGTTTGALRECCVRRFEVDREGEREQRIRAAKETLAREGIRVKD